MNVTHACLVGVHAQGGCIPGGMHALGEGGMNEQNDTHL